MDQVEEGPYPSEWYKSNGVCAHFVLYVLKRRTRRSLISKKDETSNKETTTVGSQTLRKNNRHERAHTRHGSWPTRPTMTQTH